MYVLRITPLHFVVIFCKKSDKDYWTKVLNEYVIFFITNKGIAEKKIYSAGFVLILHR